VPWGTNEPQIKSFLLAGWPDIDNRYPIARIRDQYIPSPPEVIARRYKLTAMELRVLLSIVEVGGVPAVAEALGVSTETVKTHLSRVYGKTGVNRQAELVKLVMKYMNPIAQS
jgi:DNA-binding CsgD family transcriptional regulator